MKVKIESYRALKKKYEVEYEDNRGSYLNRDFLISSEALNTFPDFVTDKDEYFILETSHKTSMGNTLVSLIYYQLERYDDLTTRVKFIKEEETLIQKQ